MNVVGNPLGFIVCAGDAATSAAGCLQHKHIVRIHEVGVHEGRHPIVIDYVEGQSLTRNNGRPPALCQSPLFHLRSHTGLASREAPCSWSKVGTVGIQNQACAYP